MKLIDHINLTHYWISGRLNNLITCGKSNIYKSLIAISNVFNNMIDRINLLYLSVYPCKGIKLLLEHEEELAIPDGNFNADKNAYMFTYTFPLPFYDGDSSSDGSSLRIRQIDVFVKKYLMEDNSERGYKRIAGCYGYSIAIETEEDDTQVAFTYNYPICFGCSANFTKVTITVYGDPSADMLQKLTFIFNYIKRIDVPLTVVKSEDDNIYNPYDYCLCEEFGK